MTKEILDWVFKLFGILLGSVAIFQLYEVRKRRLVEMYWKIAEQYLSKEGHERRLAVEKIEQWLAGQRGNSGSDSSAGLASVYRHVFHDAGTDTENKQIDTNARHHIRLLNQIGVLCRKRVVDRDLTFGLIGAGLDIDYPVLRVILEAHRSAHNLGWMYFDFDALWVQYGKWKKRQRRAQ